MRRHARGLSFLELLVAMTVTFLAISFLMGLFVSAARNNNRSKQFSTAGFLAQGKMERISATPIDQIVTGTDNFTGQYAGYVYNVDVADAGDYDGDGNPDPDMKMITLTVTAPDEQGSSRLVALRSMPEPFFGVACHATIHELTFMGSADASDPYVHGWRFPNKLDPIQLFPFAGGAASIKPMPNGGRAGDVAADPNLTSFYAVDYVNGGLRHFNNGMSDWDPQLYRPAGLGTATGLAMDGSGSMVWLTDQANRCLWLFTPSSGTWSGPIRPTSPDSLGRPMDVTCCTGGTDVYVADMDNDCVRHYVGSGTGAWQSTPIKNPDGSLDQVTGVAVTRDNTKLFVMDALTLQWTDPSNPTTWTKIDLDSKLAEDFPHGLSVSDDGKIVWAIAKNGLLFRVDVTDPANPVWEELGP